MLAARTVKTSCEVRAVWMSQVAAHIKSLACQPQNGTLSAHYCFCLPPLTIHGVRGDDVVATVAQPHESG